MIGIVGGEVSTPAEAQAPESEVQEQGQETQEKDDFADKFMRLARKERALQQAQQELKARMAEIEKMKSEYENFSNRKAKLKEDPFEALELLGVSYDDLTMAMLQHGKAPTADDRVAALEKKLQELEEKENKQKDELMQSERQKTVQTFRDNLDKFIESSDYELVKANNASELVFETMQAYYEETEKKGGPGKGVLLSFEEACKLVEADFEEQLPKLLNLNKVKAKLGMKEEKLESKAEVIQPRQSGPSQTLTQAMKAASEPATSSHRRPSDKELFERAAQMIKFT